MAKACESEGMNLPNPLISLLLQRGIRSAKQAYAFFHPQWSDLHDPFLFKDMKKAVERLERAFASGEKVLFFGDYDVDGTTSVALCVDYFSKHHDKIGFYIPKRDTDGYGLTPASLDWAASEGYNLVITLDCGITANDAVDRALVHGIDVIISDHHRPGDSLPNAVAILNPKLNECTYPDKNLSGCGVGFKLVQGFARHRGLPEEDLQPLTDLLAVSIAADLVPAIGENRILATYGMRRLNETPRPGFYALLRKLSRRRPLQLSDIVFTIAPRINAAGRMNDAASAVRLLLAPNSVEADRIAEQIDQTNADRKTVDSQITAEAFKIVEQTPDFHSRKSTVVFKRDWHKGVIGIVASRLVDVYYKPTVVLSEVDGKLTGSARSVKGFDIYNAIAECSEFIEQFGGHMYAAGLTLKSENVEAFANKFDEVVSRTIDDELLIPQFLIDGNLSLQDVNTNFYHWLSKFGPFGPGNPIPIFTAQGVLADMGSMRVVGTNHLYTQLLQKGVTKVTAVGFNMGWAQAEVKKGIPFDVCFTVEEEMWRDQVQLKVFLKDISFDGSHMAAARVVAGLDIELEDEGLAFPPANFPDSNHLIEPSHASA